MTGSEDARYRIRVAQGFLDEALQDISLERWRSAVDNAQLADELGGLTPWEIFSQSDGVASVEFAEEAVRLARTVVAAVHP